MSVLPERPSLEHLRKQAKVRKRERGIALSQAQHELAREHGFASWPKLVHAIQAGQLHGIERALVLADPPALAAVLEADPAGATTRITSLPPLLVLLRRSIGSPADVRHCTRLLLDAGADPDSHTVEWGGEGRMSALFAAVERRDLALVRLLLDAGATNDEDAFYHACEQSDTALLDALHRPGFENLVNHKLDFEDLVGLRWFLDHGVDVNAHRCLHHAISRGRGVSILTALIEAGADVNLPWDRWDVGRRPLALAARSGHLAALELVANYGGPPSWTRWTLRCSRSHAASRFACRTPRRRRWVTRTATATAGSASSPSLAAPRWCGRCSTAAYPWILAVGAISLRSSRPPCTAACRPCSYSSIGAQTCTTAPSTMGLRRWTAPSGAFGTTAPWTATTPAPCKRCLPRAPRPVTNHPPATRPSTRC